MMPLTEQASKLLSETPENEFSPLLWKILIKVEPKIEMMVDSMLCAGAKPEWIASHQPANELQAELRTAFLKCIQWRSRQLLSNA